jgi:hypothetical protein
MGVSPHVGLLDSPQALSAASLTSDSCAGDGAGIDQLAICEGRCQFGDRVHAGPDTSAIIPEETIEETVSLSCPRGVAEAVFVPENFTRLDFGSDVDAAVAGRAAATLDHDRQRDGIAVNGSRRPPAFSDQVTPDAVGTAASLPFDAITIETEDHEGQAMAVAEHA